MGKPEGQKPLGRLRRTRGYNIKMDIKETGWEGVDWTYLAHDGDKWRIVVNAVMNFRVP